MILKDLPIGAKVREPKSSVVFLVADHNHTAYTGTALVTDCAIKLASIDAAEPDNPDEAKKEFGNNFYPLSNIHQWLNSNQSDWYKPAHEFDAPPVLENIDQGRLDFYDVPFYSEEAKFIGDFSYKDAPGFLTWFSREFVDSICEVNVPCYVDPVPGEIHHGPPDPVYVRSRAFLLSAPEMGFEKTRTGTEGFRLPLFNDTRMCVVAPTPAAIGKPDDYVYDDCSLWYWLRTPILGSATTAMIYNSDHRFGDYNSSPTGRLPVRAICGIRPALNLDSGVPVSDEPDTLGIYTLLFGVE
ncbi:MAG: hypothetical protein A2144_01565 [Chloroflexi bacterium RBG_16_50_9]|nr:MAG: hypothetical protein A2144_01565 [Chloroflexi bacterium RBG_16_50_9]